MSLIALSGITKIYTSGAEPTRVLRGIELSVDTGEFVAIMGPSGSGKSTLLHILGFLDSATEGNYFFDGVLTQTFTPAEIAALRNEKIGFIFQAFNLLRKTTVLENVKLPLLYSAVPEAKWESKARAAIESVGMSHRIDHEPSQLSGGEQQRVAIARALVNDPKVIFADEPTGNLDSKSGQVVMEILDQLHRAGRTIILITHEANTARHAERIIRLRDGVVESDRKLTPEERFKNGELK